MRRSRAAPITCPHAPDTTPRDLCHEHRCALTDWNGGAMNGWDRRQPAPTSNGDNLAWAQYQESGHPQLLAVRAAPSPSPITSSPTCSARASPATPSCSRRRPAGRRGNPPTQPRRPYWGCDQSVDDTRRRSCKAAPAPTASVFPCFDIPSVPDVLPAGVTWKFYGTNFYVLPRDLVDVRRGRRRSATARAGATSSTRRSSTTDIANGTLPDVSWLVDQDLDDEHPDDRQRLRRRELDGRQRQPAHAERVLEDTAILFTMDDFGGWYDHVPPPRQYGCDAAHPYGLGFRLPLIVISPYAKPRLRLPGGGRAGVDPALHRDGVRRARRSRRSIRRRRTGRPTI